MEAEFHCFFVPDLYRGKSMCIKIRLHGMVVTGKGFWHQAVWVSIISQPLTVCDTASS